MPDSDLSVKLKAVDGAWTRLGADGSRGIVPEGFSASASEAGPDTCSFTLRRVAALPWPDLLAFNQCEVHVGGALVWGGRIWEAPLSDTEEDVIAVQGRGWQYHMDDDLIKRTYVHSRLSDWRDSRTFPTTTLTSPGGHSAIGVVNNDRGAIVLQYASGTNVAAQVVVGVTQDFGSPSEAPKRCVIEYETNSDSIDFSLYVRSHALEDQIASLTLGAYSDAISAQTFTALGRSGTIAGTFGTKYRYVTIMLYYNAGAGTFGQNWTLRIKAARMFRATAYESGNASILKSSDVVKDVLASGALPLLDQTTEAITDSAFNIPEFAPQGRQTPRALIDAVNAYEGNLAGVDARRRVFFRERPLAATLEVGEWSGSSFQDGSTNSGEGLYNRVLVQGTGPDGQTIEATRFADDVAPGLAITSDSGAISNPSFETDTTGWTAFIGSMARSTAQFFEGAASLAITSSSPGASAVIRTTSSTLPPGSYSCRFSVRHISGVVGVFGMDVLLSVETENLGVTGAAFDGSNTWKSYTVGFQLAESSTVVLQLTANISAVSTLACYLDAVRIFNVDLGLVSRQGFTRSAVLPVQSALTQASSERIGDLWLGERVFPPFKGTMTMGPGGCRHALTGNTIHPSELLLRVGERIRFCHLPDPTTGASAREGTIKSVSYTHDTETASVELDNERGRLTALLERLAIVTGQALG